MTNTTVNLPEGENVVIFTDELVQAILDGRKTALCVPMWSKVSLIPLPPAFSASPGARLRVISMPFSEPFELVEGLTLVVTGVHEKTLLAIGEDEAKAFGYANRGELFVALEQMYGPGIVHANPVVRITDFRADVDTSACKDDAKGVKRFSPEAELDANTLFRLIIRQSAKLALAESLLRAMRQAGDESDAWMDVIIDRLGVAPNTPEPARSFLQRAREDAMRDLEAQGGIESIVARVEIPEPRRELDIGFRVFKLDSACTHETRRSVDEYDQASLDELADPIKPDRTPLDLFWDAVLHANLRLDRPNTSEVVDGCTVFDYDNGELVGCFDKAIPLSVVEHMAKRQPKLIVLRDSGLSCADKLNARSVIMQHSPQTRIQVL